MAALGPTEGIAYIIATLKANSQVMNYAINGVYREVAPQAAINAGGKYILVRYQGGADVMGSFADRLFTNGLYQVAIFAPDTAMGSVLEPGAQAIDAALHRTSGNAQGGIILACYREQPLVLSEVLSGTDVLWTRAGGLYRLLVQ